MRVVLALALAVTLCGCRARNGAPASSERDVVVVLHGLGRTARSMEGLAESLREKGYRVENPGYPSTAHPVEDLVPHLKGELARCCGGASRLHFVTHSLGGILARAFLAEEPLPNLGRVVMLSPPSGGSELADVIRESAWLRRVLGPAAAQLGTDPASVPRRLPPVDFELGVIAGSRSANPVFSWLIPGPDDGKVAVERARTRGMSDFLVVPHTHTFIMDSAEVRDQVHHFLVSGSFRRQ